MQETPQAEWADAIKPGVLGADEGLINALGYVEAAKYLGINKPYRDGQLTDAASTAFGNYARAWAKRVSEALRSEQHHATKKTSTQLQREIDEVLATSPTKRGRAAKTGHATKKLKKAPKQARIVDVEAKTPAGYRWLKINARGASVTPEGSFVVTDEHEWAQSLNAAGAIEIK